MTILETDRLSLRELTEDDAPFMLRLLNDPSFLRFIGDRGVRTVEDARAYVVKGPIDSYRRLGFGFYMVQVRESRTPAGVCGLVKRDGLDDVDIGFAFLPEFRSQGYALESAAAVIAYARETLGLKRLVALVAPDNARSIRLLGKLGLRFERRLPWPPDGAEVELHAAALHPASRSG